MVFPWFKIISYRSKFLLAYNIMIFKTIKYAYFRIFFHHNLQDTGSNNPLESCGIGRYFHTVIQSMERCLLARLADLHRTDNKKRFEEGVLPLTQGKQYDIISIIILVVIKLYVRVLTVAIDLRLPQLPVSHPYTYLYHTHIVRYADRLY